MLPRRPTRHQVGVGEQHARRIGVSLEHADRLARLHQQRFIVLESAQRLDDLVVTLPVARGAADAAIDNQFLRMLGHVRIEIVHQHPERGFGEPRLATDLLAARRANDARSVKAGIHGAAPSPPLPCGEGAGGEGRTIRCGACFLFRDCLQERGGGTPLLPYLSSAREEGFHHTTLPANTRSRSSGAPSQ